MSEEIRCAIYTRKSTDEGLDREFNSLDAQYDACASYVASQRGEGWRLLPDRYDDGGFSGGTNDRPALKRLLSEITRRRIDLVVVYKIDRLSRSLMGFSKLMETFDRGACSFVSITQSFNTSSSMGRLSLNMLLSFAQFEREITAERIKDKIAASKRLGMFTGGSTPLGYVAVDRKLVIHEPEAETVRTVFDLYLKHRCVTQTWRTADEMGLRSRAQKTLGGASGEGPRFSRSRVHWMLTNCAYVGEVRHHDHQYAGRHAPIISREKWNAVQKLLGEKLTGSGRGVGKSRSSSPFVGRIFDDAGERLTPTYNRRGEVVRRYYISKKLVLAGGNKGDGWRLRADFVEQLVSCMIVERLQKADFRDLVLRECSFDQAMRAKTCLDSIVSERPEKLLLALANRVTLGTGAITVDLDRDVLAATLDLPGHHLPAEVLRTTGSFQRRTKWVESRAVIQGDPDPGLVLLLTKSREWWNRVLAGETIERIARSEGVSARIVSRRIKVAFLAPDVAQLVLSGGASPELSATRLTAIAAASLWEEQREHVPRRRTNLTRRPT